MGKEAVIGPWVPYLDVLLAVWWWYWFRIGQATYRGAWSGTARRLILGLGLCSMGQAIIPHTVSGAERDDSQHKTNKILFHQLIYSFHWSATAGIRLSHLVFCFEFVLSSLSLSLDQWRGGVSLRWTDWRSLLTLFPFPCQIHYTPIRARLTGQACFNVCSGTIFNGSFCFWFDVFFFYIHKGCRRLYIIFPINHGHSSLLHIFLQNANHLNFDILGKVIIPFFCFVVIFFFVVFYFFKQLVFPPCTSQMQLISHALHSQRRCSTP